MKTALMIIAVMCAGWFTAMTLVRGWPLTLCVEHDRDTLITITCSHGEKLSRRFSKPYDMGAVGCGRCALLIEAREEPTE